MKKILSGFLLAALIILFTLGVLFRPESADVVVIGGGAAGISAAIEAAERGARVILLEKMSYLGGNTLRATGGINGAETAAQGAAGIVDTREEFFRDTVQSGHGKNDKNLVRIMIDRSAGTIQWLTDLGADLKDVGRLAGHGTSRTHRPSGGAPVGKELLPVLTARLHSLGVEVRTENKAVELDFTRPKGGEPPRILGVFAETREGRRYKIKAGAVVVATGGFGASPELYVKMNPDLRGFKTTNHPGANGDYLDLLQDLQVALVDMAYIQAHPTVEPDNGVLITEAVRGNGGILVNREGNRFTDELAFRDILSRHILEQPEKSAYLIFDRSIRESLSATDTYFALNLIDQAETLPVLAGKLGISPRGLEEGVARYNAFYRGGIDEEFGRNNMARPLKEPPFFGVKVVPAVHHCMGGIKIDTKTRVLDQEGRIIPGLYAAGEATGGVHGANRLGGNSLTDAVTFGRMAGAEAARFRR